MIATVFRKHWDACMASVAACIFVYLFTRHSGIGVSPDSVMYASTAANIRDHFSFTDFNGRPLVDFPLGYPSLLALFSFGTGMDIFRLVPIVNAAAFCGLIFLTSIVFTGFRNSSLFAKACLLSLLACSPALLEVYSMLWSETIFLFLVLLFMVVMRQYLRKENTLLLCLAAMVVALAFVTRYAGISLLATGALLVIFWGNLSPAKKTGHLLLFTLVSISLVTGNLVRNRLVSGSSTGVREKALHTLADNLLQAGTVLGDWLPFLKGYPVFAAVLFVIALVAVIIGVAYSILQQQYYPSYENIVAAFFLSYTVFILGVATISRFEDLSSRLLSPLYIPLLLLCGKGIMIILQKCSSAGYFVAAGLAMIVFAGFHYNHYRQNAEAWEGMRDAGIPGYSEDSWTGSATAAFLRKNRSLYTRVPLFGNANDAVFFLTGMHALPLPHKEIQKEIAGFLRYRSFYLVWFTDGENHDLVDLAFIKQHKTIVLVNELKDGAVYFCKDEK